MSQAQQMEWLREDYPQLYSEFQERVKEGRMFVTGGSWTEMDCNIPSGESIIRQFLYGQRFFKKEFGHYCTEFWLPDTFGYSSQLPQLVKSAQMKYFLTQKLSWNLINKFPNSSFIWEGLDGTQILTHFPPADTYNAQALFEEVCKSQNNNKDKERTKESLMVLGHGDGGGGPQRQMLERIKRMGNLDGCPRLEMRSPHEFFERLEKDQHKLVKWRGELYFELHRGTYTTHAFVKKGNRESEKMLHDAEILATFAVLEDKVSPQKTNLDVFWKKLLLTQFHDVLPGTCIGRVYKDVRKDLQFIEEGVTTQIRSHLSSLSSPGDEFTPFNSLCWTREKVLTIPKQNKTCSNKHQISRNGEEIVCVSAPPFSFGTVFPYKGEGVRLKEGKEIVLENQFLRGIFSVGGQLVSLYDKKANREIIQMSPLTEQRGPIYGNQFVIYEDVPFFWDAWDLMVFHLEKKHLVAPAHSYKIEENGSLRCCVSFQYHVGQKSFLTQYVSLSCLSQRLEFECEVNWQESHKCLKVLFPVDIHSETATFHTQFGWVRRPTHRSDTLSMAKFEVCGHFFADLSEHKYGVSLINDSKYGYSVIDNCLSLTLLRAPKKPDRTADMGDHQFKFAIYPHEGGFPGGQVMKESYDFNYSFQNHFAQGPKKAGFPINFVGEDVLLDTIKLAEDQGEEDETKVVFRLVELGGGREWVELNFVRNIKDAKVVNILEEEEKGGGEVEMERGGKGVRVYVKPFKVVTLLVTFLKGKKRKREEGGEEKRKR
uniref:alpha-mannosidase n=1 Tax=Paramoeba aestuarina TaxID=180227 RepID=A0A7S4NLE7_9EUKA|mmetsp:Transcript_18517/g.29010  ORF Transcript_18517/g.29010 Transcript_18517/m.29010 type:complete len:766 (+) Transcript_18517:244-2541(+)